MRRAITRTALAALAALVIAGPAPGADDGGFAAEAGEFEERIAMFASVDPLQPATFTERLAYGAFLVANAADGPDCLPRLVTAEAQAAPILAATAATLLAQPDALPDATALLQSVQLRRGQCTADEAASRAAFQAAIATGLRAVELHRENWNFEQMAIAQFNVGAARRDLGDAAGALRDLEQVIAWDAEFGLLEEQAGDYETLLAWRDPDGEPDDDAVAKYEAALAQRKAKLTFAWQPFRAQWTLESEREELRKGSVAASRLRVGGESEALREGAGWILRSRATSAPEFPGGDGADAGAGRLQKLVAGLLAGGSPDMVIGADGSFVGLRDMEQYRARVLGAIEQAVVAELPPAEAEKALPELRRTLGAVLSPEMLTNSVSSEWGMLVAAWAGTEFDHGDWYELELEEPIPGLGDRPVKRKMTFKVSRWLPCAAAGPPDCVELLARVVPDRDSTRLAINDFVRRVLPAGAATAQVDAALAAVSYEIDTRYRLVTEPATLRPWSMETRKFIYVSTVDGGRREVNARRERQLNTTRY